MSQRTRTVRRRGNRPTSKFIFVMGEGDTEQAYFEKCIEDDSGYRLRAKVSKKKDQLGILNHCIDIVEEKGLNLNEGDLAICVFDLDTIKKEKDFKDIIKIAREKKIILAMSNPCFETWILMHYRDPINGMCCELTIEKLKEHLPNYEKTGDHYDELKPLLPKAVGKANRLFGENASYEDCFTCNASVTVHQAVEMILSLARD